MGDSSIIDPDKLMSFSDDLVELLRDKRDLNDLTLSIDNAESFLSSCNADFNQLQSSIQEYERRIDACRQKTEEAKAEVAAQAEVDLLLKELEDEAEKERALEEELRVVMNEINELKQKGISIEERKQAMMKRYEKDEMRTERKLSMYASVTNIIPDLNEQSKTSGYMVDRNKKVVNKFEYDPEKMTAFETCQSIWKAINSS